MKQSTKTIVLSLLIILGTILLAFTYILAYDGIFYDVFYFTSIVLFTTPIFIILLNENVSENRKVLLIFVLGTIVYILHVFPSTVFFHFSDELITLQTTNLIYETGSNNVQPYFETSKYYFGLEILTVFLKHFTNEEIFLISKILIGLIHSTLLTFVYLFFKNITTKKIAIIGAFLYAVSTQYIYFDAMFSYESLGIFFVISILYLLSKLLKPNNDKQYLIILMILLFALTITHPLSSIMFLLFLIILFLFNTYKVKIKNTNINIHINKLIFLTILFIFGWMIFEASITMKYLVSTFTERFIKILNIQLITGTHSVYNTLDGNALSIYEFVIDSFIYVPLVLVLSFIGIYYVFSKKTEIINLFTYTLIVYGVLLYIISLIFISTSGRELAYRSWGFLHIGVVFFMSVALSKMYERKILSKIFCIICIIFLVIGSFSISNKPVQREPDLLSPKLVSGSGSLTTDVFYSATWFEKNFGKHNVMVGDKSTSILFNTYGNQNVKTWSAHRIFIPEKINESVLYGIKEFNIKYIIVDTRMLKSLSESKKYFDYNGEINYGSTNLLPVESLNKFNVYDEYYNNGNILLYNIN